MRPARKEHALLAPLLGAAPVKGVIYFGAELMVRIHLPPAVNRTNFRIAPLARPDLVERIFASRSSVRSVRGAVHAGLGLGVRWLKDS